MKSSNSSKIWKKKQHHISRKQTISHSTSSFSVYIVLNSKAKNEQHVLQQIGEKQMCLMFSAQSGTENLMLVHLWKAFSFSLAALSMLSQKFLECRHFLRCYSYFWEKLYNDNNNENSSDKKYLWMETVSVCFNSCSRLDMRNKISL